MSIAAAADAKRETHNGSGILVVHTLVALAFVGLALLFCSNCCQNKILHFCGVIATRVARYTGCRTNVRAICGRNGAWMFVF